VDRFWKDAWSVFETARNAAPEPGAGALNVLIDDAGALRIVSGEGWRPEALQMHYGARAVYQVTQTAGGVRVSGRSRSDSCVLESTPPAARLAGLPGWRPYRLPEARGNQAAIEPPHATINRLDGAARC
jgi:hypothetical protein